MKLWTTYFVDLSNNNGPANMREIAHHSRTTGITAVELKASEGTTFVDDLYHAARDEAERWGLRTFAYHFARPNLHSSTDGAVAEAEHFCTVVGKVRPGEWRPMLDFETAPFAADWVRAWNATVRKRLGIAPTIYSYPSALAGMGLAKPLSDGLILADWNGTPQHAPPPRPWKGWVGHQYSDTGRVAGVAGRVDLNWTGSVWSLLAFPVRGAALEPLYRTRRRRA